MFSQVWSEVAGSVAGSKFTAIVAFDCCTALPPRQQAGVGIALEPAPQFSE
jgi:hypothetical protein